MMNRLRGERCTNGVISIMFNRQKEFRHRLIFNFILIATQNGAHPKRLLCYTFAVPERARESSGAD